MKQAITGVTPPDVAETTVMAVFPSIAALPLGRHLGQFYNISEGPTKALSFGRLFLGLFAPISLLLYFVNLAPGVVRRYRLTNQRLVVQRGLLPKDERWVKLDDFDSIEVVVQPGYEWYHAGDLVFRKGNVETFRIYAVRRPDTFRATCMKAHKSFVGVKKAVSRQLAHA